MKVALIGKSGYASLYYKTLLQKHKEGLIIFSDLISIHVHSAEEIKELEQEGINFHDSLIDFFNLKLEIDLLCIPTSIHSHYDLVLKGLDNGYNILVEKPAAATSVQIKLLNETAESKGLKVFVGYQNLYEPETWRIKEALVNGHLGQIESAHLLGLWPRSEEYFIRNEWAGKVEFEGKPVFDSVIHNAFAHFVNLMLFWTGKTLNESNRVTNANGKLLRAYDIESFDTASVQLETENQVPIYVNLSHACTENMDPLIKVIGTKGNLIWAGNYYEINNERYAFSENAGDAIVRARYLMFESVFKSMKGEKANSCSLTLAEPLTHLIGLLHAQIEIEKVAYSVLNTKHGKQHIIPSIEILMKKAFEKGGIIKKENRY